MNYNIVGVLEQRMYFLVMYNLSEIQKGIQAGHAQQEYANKYSNKAEFKRWSIQDKTWMVMNGGTSNRTGFNEYNDKVQLGSMELYKIELENMDYNHACFYEPDLNNSLSAIAFLVDNRVWDKEKYPDPLLSELYSEEEKMLDSPELRDQKIYEYFKQKFDPQTAFMRMWIKKFRFA